ncbi:hypothetical protein Bca52824_003492 [Brassica carinata]|uniref:Uncharacterized protein n=1 Tax=Brassica carinata TaxID=52824 RepID=A0A8X7WMU2_BRACI|nr:hypothetical protein Bca52824_003492 [Brassica carinata]
MCLHSGEITLEDLLLKARIVAETIVPQNVVNVASNGQWVEYHQPQHQRQGFMPHPVSIRRQGQQTHAEALKIGDSSVEAVVSSLISKYSKWGCFEDAAKAFSEREDEVMWSSMISAYGFHGHSDEAIELFNTTAAEQTLIHDGSALT